jgi:hypothetical protein
MNSSSQVLDGNKIWLFSHFPSLGALKKAIIFSSSQSGFFPCVKNSLCPPKMAVILIFHTIPFSL